MTRRRVFLPLFVVTAVCWALPAWGATPLERCREGVGLARQGKYVQAVKVWHLAFKERSKLTKSQQVTLALSLARAYQRLGIGDNARSSLAVALQLDPANKAAVALKAQIPPKSFEDTMKRASDAMAAAVRAELETPGSGAAGLRNVVPVFRRALASGFSVPLANFALGTCLLYLDGPVPQAEAHLNQARRCLGDSSAILFRLAEFKRAAGDIDAEIDLLTQILNSGRLSTKVLVALAKAHGRRNGGNDDDAVYGFVRKALGKDTDCCDDVAEAMDDEEVAANVASLVSLAKRGVLKPEPSSSGSSGTIFIRGGGSG